MKHGPVCFVEVCSRSSNVLLPDRIKRYAMAFLPVISQTKSAYQLLRGDRAGAAATHREFLERCPVVSQVNAAARHATGDRDAGRVTTASHR